MMAVKVTPPTEPAVLAYYHMTLEILAKLIVFKGRQASPGDDQVVWKYQEEA
jgi:hypothetical protein